MHLLYSSCSLFCMLWHFMHYIYTRNKNQTHYIRHLKGNRHRHSHIFSLVVIFSLCLFFFWLQSTDNVEHNETTMSMWSVKWLKKRKKRKSMLDNRSTQNEQQNEEKNYACLCAGKRRLYLKYSLCSKFKKTFQSTKEERIIFVCVCIFKSSTRHFSSKWSEPFSST